MKPAELKKKLLTAATLLQVHNLIQDNQADAIRAAVEKHFKKGGKK